MRVSQSEGDRTSLDGFEGDIFNLVGKEVTSEQWKEWPRVPQEHVVAKGDIDLFTRLMDTGAGGNTGWRGCCGQTLLGSAAGGGSEEMVLALLKAGGRASRHCMWQRHRAQKPYLQTLMLAGEDPDLRDGGGVLSTPCCSCNRSSWRRSRTAAERRFP
ncbi:unnamed protein product [Pylaiella littoralis]